jgi:formylglycine-generating enzyme required for sulfatase activity
MLGNAFEWCQDRPFFYSTDSPLVEDSEHVGLVRDSENRVLRGGSFNLGARYVRSAYRGSNRPDDRNTSFGFRVARTYP